MVTCPFCNEDTLQDSYCRVMVDGIRVWVVTGLQCPCGYHENDENGLKIMKYNSRKFFKKREGLAQDLTKINSFSVSNFLQ